MAPIEIPLILEQAWKKYRKHFGKEYPQHLSFSPWKEQVADIERRIKNNKPARDDTEEELSRCY